MRSEHEWRRWLYALSSRLVGNRDAVEDIVQEVLVKFWQTFDILPWQHPTPSYAKAICYRFVRSEAVQYYRTLSRQVKTVSLELIHNAVLTYDPQEELIEQSTAATWLNNLLPSLSPQQRIILSLLREGYTFAEVSHRMKISVGAVKQQVHRIRQKAIEILSTTSRGSSELSSGGARNDVESLFTVAEESEEVGGGGSSLLPKHCLLAFMGITAQFGFSQINLEEQLEDVDISSVGSTPHRTGRIVIVNGISSYTIEAFHPTIRTIPQISPNYFFKDPYRSFALGNEAPGIGVEPGLPYLQQNDRQSLWFLRGVALTNPYHQPEITVGRNAFRLRSITEYSLNCRVNISNRAFELNPQLPPNRSIKYVSFILWDAVVSGYLGNAPTDQINLSVQARACHQEQEGSDCNDLDQTWSVQRTGLAGTTVYSPRHLLARLYEVSVSYERSDQSRNRRVDLIRGRSAVDGEATFTMVNPHGGFIGVRGIQYTTALTRGVLIPRSVSLTSGSQSFLSLDPLGIAEMGENEYVFRETSNGVRLDVYPTVAFAHEPQPRDDYGPDAPVPPPFLDSSFSPNIGNSYTNFFAQRLRWRCSTGLPMSQGSVGLGWWRELTGKVTWYLMPSSFRYTASILPELNLFGKHTIETIWDPTPSQPNSGDESVLASTPIEVFFPALGRRHPSGAQSDPLGTPIPNWFYYYWSALGRREDVFFTQHDPYGNALGFYQPHTNRIFIVDRVANFSTFSSSGQTLQLFMLSEAECPPGSGNRETYIRSADTLTVRGIYAFARVLYHEAGHQWTYTTFHNGQPIAGLRGRMGDADGDGLLDEWEMLHYLCPYNKDTTGIYNYPPYDELGGDAEVVAELFSYNALMRRSVLLENNPQRDIPLKEIWKHDYSDFGLQFGNPSRFTSFPWTYASTGRSDGSAHPVLEDLPRR